MNRRRVLVGLGAVAVVGAVPGVVVLGGGDHDPGAAADVGTRPPSPGAGGRPTAKIARRDLAEKQDVSGTLGFGPSHDLMFSRPGIVTALAPVGTVVDRGGVLGEVNGLPVPLFFGERPLWRALDIESGPADGPDIEQLEANLVALGFGTEAVLGPDRRFTTATAAAVKRWQRSLGVDQTGIVAPGDVAFDAGPVRVAAHAVAVSGPSPAPALTVTGTTRVVEVDLEARHRALVAVDQQVEVELPDRSTTLGTITAVGTVAMARQQGGEATVPVTVVLVDQAAGPGLDQSPVTVRLTTSQATGVLAVPVPALLAVTEGGYAVEKVTGAATELVAVSVGPIADGWAQVTGALAEGDDVVVPG